MILGGIIVSLVFAFCYLIGAIKRKFAKQWDGVVIDKKIVEKRVKRKDEYHTETYYITRFKTDKGSKKKLKEPGVFHPYYDYLNVNDKVRFHPEFNNFYEKYDKTQDSTVICPICLKETDICKSHCAHCGTILVK